MQTHAHTRLHLLDSLRGLALLNMIAYHALYDVVYIFGHPMGWYQGWPGYLWQQCICWCFILLSGFCAGIRPLPPARARTSGFMYPPRGSTSLAACALLIMQSI